MSARASLMAAARAVGVESRAPALLDYIEAFARWNQRINLSAARTPDEITEHVVDCLALVPHVPEGARVVDIGSGGGLPGIVLAAARTDLQVTCVEPIHKKSAFLRQAGRDLTLRLTVLTQRVGGLERAYEVAVSRATFDLTTWLDVGLDLVVPGGIVLAMEGLEQIDLPANATRHSYRLRDRTRAIIVRTSPSPQTPPAT